MNYQLEEIESIEEIQNGFNNEYVYDVEVNNTHMLFANNILVHNSVYYEFGRITSQLNIPKEKQAHFIVDLWNRGCGPYMNEMYKRYAKYFNCDENLQVLELEKIARTAILKAKKHYAMEESFKEPNIYLNPMEEILYKGLENIMGSCPAGVRKIHEDFIKFLLSHYIDHDNNPSLSIIIDKMKKYKSEFMLMDIEDISKTATVGNYEKFILDDKNSLVIGEHCPIHVRAAGDYNYILNQPKNRKYKGKYNIIQTRDKIKFYKTKNQDIPVFGFLPNNYPAEFALPIDYNQQFSDLVLTPLNGFITLLGYQPLNINLVYSESLF